MNLYNDLIHFEPINSFEDLLHYFEKSGFNFEDFKYDKDFYLAQKCQLLAEKVRTESLPPDKRTDGNIIPDMLLHGAFYTFLILMGSPRNLHGITPDALNIIKTTKISLDIEDIFIADLVDKPYFLYSLNNEPLYDDVLSISIFIDDSDFVSCIINQMDGRSFNKDIPFDRIAKVLDEQNIQIDENPVNNAIIERGLADDLKLITQKIYKGFFLLAQFLLLLECEKTPIFIDYLHPKDKKASLSKKMKKINRKISYKKVSLTTEYKSRIQEKNSQSQEKLNKEGKLLIPIRVSGHIRSQPYGTGNKLRKLIYIEEHESKSWVNTEIRKITVLK